MVQLNYDGKRSLGSGIAFAFVATIAVGLRMLTKTVTNARWAADDGLAVASLLAVFAWFGVEFWGIISGGGGEDIQTITLENQFDILETYLKSLYTLNPLYSVAITLIRLSILALYRRVFSVQRFKQITIVIAAICFVWFIVFTGVALAPCRPVQKFFNPQLEGYCFNFDSFFVAIEIIDIILDATILVLPIRVILRLQISVQRKVLLSFVFLLGGFVIITGIIRIQFVYVPHSSYISFTKGVLWTNVHLGTAIMCANIPTYPPLFSPLATFGTSLRSHLNSLFSDNRPLRDSQDTAGHSMKSFSNGHKQYDQLKDPSGDKRFLQEDVSAAHCTNSQRSGHDFDSEPHQILVKNTVEVV